MSSTNKTSHYNLPQFIGSDIPTWLGDFNSAMSAIDSGINAAATSASGAATDAAAAQKSANDAASDAAAAQRSADDALRAANRCPFPLGYGGFFQTDPNTIYSGTTWQQKKDVFILASGNTYGAGSTGGEAQHRLTVNEMPEHRHSSDSFMNGYAGTSTETNKYITWVNKGTEQTNAPIGTSGPVNTTYSGGGAAHNNMPPYFSMPFWIRTA